MKSYSMSLNLIIMVLSGVHLLSCEAQESLNISAVQMTTSYALEGACPTDLQAKPFSQEITALKARVNADDLSTPITAKGKIENFSIDEIPAGEGRRLLIEGLVNNKVVWRGFRDGITIKADQSHRIDLMLTKIADMSCARNVMYQKRAFHTATELQDGTILIAGGANSSRECGEARCLEATIYAEIYDPNTGTFTELPSPMHRGRMFHQATLLEDGRVLFTGGAREVEFTSVSVQNPFPIRVIQATAVMEIFDPVLQRFSIVAEDTDPRVFHTAVKLEDGRIWINGGISGLPESGSNDLHNALKSSFICDKNVKACQKFTDLEEARVGHSSLLMDNGDVYVFGGVVLQVGSGTDAPIAWAEKLAKGAPKSQILDIQNITAEQNLFFSKAHLLSDQNIIFSGGLIFDENGVFQMATDLSGTYGRFYLYQQSAGNLGRLQDLSNAQVNPLRLEQPTFFHQVSAMGDDRLMLSGGFKSLDFTPSFAMTLYDVKLQTLSPISVKGKRIELKEARSGHQSLYLKDGTLIFIGGLTGAIESQSLKQSAEIFNDPFFNY